jgi:hypothetical protein
MKKSISVLKNYFKKGDKPTQQQFYDFLESFVHLDSTILASQVQGLETALNKLNELGINDVSGLQTALNGLNTALSTLEVADISGLQFALDTLSNVAIGDVSGLTEALNSLATRSISQVTGLQEELNNKVEAVNGFGLSENNFSTAYIQIINQLQQTLNSLINDFIQIELTASKVLDLDDQNTRIVFENTNPTSLSVPLDANVAFDEGAKIKGTVKGNGAVTISGAGITFIGNNLVFVKGESFVLTNIDVDVWVVEGNLSTSSVEPTYNTFIGGMSAVITDLNSLVPFIKVFGGAGAGYNSSNISQVVKNFKIENGIVKFLAISDYATGDFRGSQAGGACTFYHDEGGFVKSHEGGFFRGNTNVYSIKMPKLKSIADFVFEYPTNLSEYNFDSVEYIGGGGNFEYSKITYLRFPKLRSCWSFKGCSLLPATIDKFSFPDFNEHIGENLFIDTPVTSVHFANCETFTNSTFRSSGLQTVIAPKLKKIGAAVFMRTDKGVGSPRYLDFPLVEEVGDLSFYEARNVLLINIPKCKKLGSSPTDYNQVFEGITSDNGLVINVHYFLKTCNAGAPDPDLVYAIGRGAIVNYINDLPQKFEDEIIPVTTTFVDDTAAAAGGVKIGQRYVTPTGNLKVRLT